MRTRKLIPCLAVMFILAIVPAASALDIVTQYIGGAEPADSVGGGNLPDIVNAAAHIWESVYSDPGTLTIYYGWGPSLDAGTHTLIDQGYSPNREIAGMIIFDNSGSNRFYMDPTPYLNEEYRGRTDEFQDLGGGSINVARLMKSPATTAAGELDLLSVALHEMGHALGMSAANRSFSEQCANALLIISGPTPFPGTEIPIGYNNTGIIAHFDALEIAYGSLMAGINAGERRLPSELDIVSNAQLSGFSVSSLVPRQSYPVTRPAAKPQTGSKSSSPSASKIPTVTPKSKLQVLMFKRLFGR